MLPVDDTMHHQDVAGAEIGLLLLVVGGDGDGGIEVVRQTGAVHHLHAGGVVQKGAVDAAAVRALIVHNLVIGLDQGRFLQQVFQGVTVFHFRQTQYGMPYAGFGLDIGQHLGDILQFHSIFVGRPFIGTVREVFVVVLAFVVEHIEEVLHVVEANYMLPSLLLGTSLGGEQQRNGCQNEDDPFHVYRFQNLLSLGFAAFTVAALSAGRFTKNVIPVFSSSSFRETA